MSAGTSLFRLLRMTNVPSWLFVPCPYTALHTLQAVHYCTSQEFAHHPCPHCVEYALRGGASRLVFLQTPILQSWTTRTQSGVPDIVHIYLGYRRCLALFKLDSGPLFVNLAATSKRPSKLPGTEAAQAMILHAFGVKLITTPLQYICIYIYMCILYST